MHREARFLKHMSSDRHVIKEETRFVIQSLCLISSLGNQISSFDIISISCLLSDNFGSESLAPCLGMNGEIFFDSKQFDLVLLP